MKSLIVDIKRNFRLHPPVMTVDNCNWYLVVDALYSCIPSNLSVLPDPRNMGVLVGISLLSCIKAEIYVISYLLPVNGRYL